MYSACLKIGPLCSAVVPTGRCWDPTSNHCGRSTVDGSPRRASGNDPGHVGGTTPGPSQTKSRFRGATGLLEGVPSKELPLLFRKELFERERRWNRCRFFEKPCLVGERGGSTGLKTSRFGSQILATIVNVVIQVQGRKGTLGLPETIVVTWNVCFWKTKCPTT